MRKKRPKKKEEPVPEKKIGQFTLFSILMCVAAASLGSFIYFPAGDSWTQGWTVQEWMDGNFVLNDWASALALPQQILGWAINIGSDSVSWSGLSILTALVTMLGCLLAARLPARLFPQWPGLTEWAPLFTFVLLAPTFTMKIAAGFMTDGYYLFFLAASMYILLGIIVNPPRWSNSEWTWKWLGFATLATLAALQRTHGLLLLFVVAIWVLVAKIIRPGDETDENFKGWRGWFPVIISILGFAFALAVLKYPGFAPARTSEVTLEMRRFWEELFASPGLALLRPDLLVGILQHFGLAMLPVIFIARMQKAKEERAGGKKVVNWWYVTLGTLFIILMFMEWTNRFKAGAGIWFPYSPNSLSPEGFGPRSDTLVLTAGHELATWIRFILTVLGTCGGIFLAWLLSRTVRLKGVNWRSPGTLIALIGLAHIAIIFVNKNFFDRYLLPMMPFALMWLAPLLKNTPAKSRLPLWILTLALLAFSLWGTADFLGWTRAKWDISNKAREMGMPANQIVVGYDVDGIFNYSNETYPGLVFEGRPNIGVWWVDRLGMRNQPYYIVFEEGADPSGTFWKNYIRTEISNDRMRVWANPVVFQRQNGE